MEKISHRHWPEIVFGSSDSAASQAIRRAIKAGELRKLAPKIYTSNMTDSPEDIFKRNLYQILDHLFPGAVISYRSAFEHKPTDQGDIVLSYKYTKSINYPGIIIHLIKAPSHLEGDMKILNNIYLASPERYLLENLKPAKKHSLGQAFVEERLDKICKIRGEDELNIIRDKAKKIAKSINMEKQFLKLDKIISAILRTNDANILQTPQAKARATQEPFDSDRVELFTRLIATLNASVLPIVKYNFDTKTTLSNFAFFEAYFSNFIEGTEFLIEEAEEIVFQNKIIPNRSEDSHDILGTYQIISNTNELKKIPNSFDELISILKNRHYTMLEPRSNALPGEFKTEPNRAGNTIFVEPELVLGTLKKAYELYTSLTTPFARAIFMMFIIAEIHPFKDGNGRIARIMMNAELSSGDETRIIIPTVYREDYMLALRRLTRAGEADAYIKMLIHAQRFTSSIDFNDFENAMKQLKKSNAFELPQDAKLIILT